MGNLEPIFEPPDFQAGRRKGDLLRKLADDSEIEVYHESIDRHLRGIDTEQINIELLNKLEKVYQLCDSTFTRCLRSNEKQEVLDLNLSMGNLLEIINYKFLHNYINMPLLLSLKGI